MSGFEQYDVECAGCELDCQYRGASPLPIDDDKGMRCTVMAERVKSFLVAVPTALNVGLDGNVRTVTVTLVPVRKGSRWRRSGI